MNIAGLPLGGRMPYITSKNRLRMQKLHIKDITQCVQIFRMNILYLHVGLCDSFLQISPKSKKLFFKVTFQEKHNADSSCCRS